MTRPLVKLNKFKKACAERDELEARITALEARERRVRELATNYRDRIDTFGEWGDTFGEWGDAKADMGADILAILDEGAAE